MDYLYDFFGGKELYTKEEWDERKKRTYDLVERDNELETDTQVFETNKSYDYCFNSLTRIGLKDYDFVIEMRDHETGEVLAQKSWGVHGSTIGVVRGNNTQYIIH